MTTARHEATAGAEDAHRLRERLHAAQLLVTIGNGPAVQVARRCFGLTAREAEVLRWLTAGKTNPEIATILATGTRTVGTHVAAILRKTGAATRTEVLRRVLAVVLAGD